MKIVLIIFLLGVQSSYSENREVPVDGFADTVQWKIGEDGNWRVKTYAIDEDVHPFVLDDTNRTYEEWIALARQNTEEHYGDILVGELILESTNGLDGLRLQLAEHGLSAHLNVGKDGLIFWSPEGTEYQSRSVPYR